MHNGISGCLTKLVVVIDKHEKGKEKEKRIRWELSEPVSNSTENIDVLVYNCISCMLFIMLLTYFSYKTQKHDLHVNVLISKMAKNFD